MFDGQSTLQDPLHYILHNEWQCWETYLDVSVMSAQVLQVVGQYSACYSLPINFREFFIVVSVTSTA